MQLRVQRTSGMPHNVQAWTESRPGEVIVWIDDDLITEEGAAALQQALTAGTAASAVALSHLSPPQLRLHIG